MNVPGLPEERALDGVCRSTIGTVECCNDPVWSPGVAEWDYAIVRLAAGFQHAPAASSGLASMCCADPADRRHDVRGDGRYRDGWDRRSPHCVRVGVLATVARQLDTDCLSNGYTRRFRCVCRRQQHKGSDRDRRGRLVSTRIDQFRGPVCSRSVEPAGRGIARQGNNSQIKPGLNGIPVRIQCQEVRCLLLLRLSA